MQGLLSQNLSGMWVQGISHIRGVYRDQCVYTLVLQLQSPGKVRRSVQNYNYLSLRTVSYWMTGSFYHSYGGIGPIKITELPGGNDDADVY